MRVLALVAAAVLARSEIEGGGESDWTSRYLEKHRFKKDVIAMPSGLMYKVIERGGGKRHPTPNTEVLCHYEGQTAFMYERGKRRWQTFDSSERARVRATHDPLAVLCDGRGVCHAQVTSAASRVHSLPTA